MIGASAATYREVVIAEDTDATPVNAGGGISKLQAERQHQIYRLVLRNGAVDVSDLAQRFEVTTETIRRDLSDMQERQLVRRVHGGAVPLERNHHEPMINARDAQNTDEKIAIGRLALEEIPAGSTILLDSGSTSQRFAKLIPAELAGHIVTNSLLIATSLLRRGVTELSVLGGSVRPNTYAMVDSQTIEAVRSMRVDVLFLSCDGLSFKRGLTTPYRQEHFLKRAMIESARRVVAIVDQSKFGNDQTFSYAGLHEIDLLLTDRRATDDEVDILTEAGVEVRRA